MSTITCPNCSAQVPAGAAFCDNCGTPLAAASRPIVLDGSELHCPRCGERVLADESFCSNCGEPLAFAAQAAENIPGVCPNCHSPVQDDDLFCDNCGHALLPAPGYPVSPQRPAETIAVSPPTNRPPAVSTPSYPRLLVQPGGNVLTLAPGMNAYVIGREDPASGSHPDVDLVPYGGEEGGVSRRHAQITRSGEQFFIEDLNSVNYTFVNKQKIAIGIAHPLRDGDEIRLGRVLLRFKSG